MMPGQWKDYHEGLAELARDRPAADFKNQYLGTFVPAEGSVTSKAEYRQDVAPLVIEPRAHSGGDAPAAVAPLVIPRPGELLEAVAEHHEAEAKRRS